MCRCAYNTRANTAEFKECQVHTRAQRESYAWIDKHSDISCSDWISSANTATHRDIKHMVLYDTSLLQAPWPPSFWHIKTTSYCKRTMKGSGRKRPNISRSKISHVDFPSSVTQPEDCSSRFSNSTGRSLSSLFWTESEHNSSKRQKNFLSSQFVSERGALFCVCGVDSFLPELEHL